MSELSFNQRGYQTLTVSTTSVGLTKPTDILPRHALIFVGAAAIRWRADGTDPTSTVGMFVAAGSYIDWTDPMGDYQGLIDRVEFIRDSTAAGDATLAIAYFD